MRAGRNLYELPGVIDSIQLTAVYRVATPANWNRLEEVILTTVVFDAEPQNRACLPSIKACLRMAEQPKRAGD